MQEQEIRLVNIPGTNLAVPELYRLPSLPYAGCYSMWVDHLEQCPVCQPVMAEDGTQEIEDLCWTGRGLNYALTFQITQTAENAVWS